uniref:Uncharacterized protein n=1 Tax=Arundo donax TaxID=35708 RepID=A0A0A9HCP6_ARUDO
MIHGNIIWWDFALSLAHLMFFLVNIRRLVPKSSSCNHSSSLFGNRVMAVVLLTLLLRFIVTLWHAWPNSQFAPFVSLSSFARIHFFN